MEHDVVIVGGGPAGMMAGLLLARAGIDTIVLEKHADFFRDFRGDTVHPSTMEILYELGLLNRFLARPHNRIDQAELSFAGRELKIGDLRYLKTPAPFIAMIPQWEFLDFLRDEAATFNTFHLAMTAAADSLIEKDGRVCGVRMADGTQVNARKLAIMADGRESLVRQKGLLPVSVLGAPMDVFWFAIPKSPEVLGGLRGSFYAGRILVQIDRGDYWQCAFLIAKGSAAGWKAKGIDALRAEVEKAAPELGSLGTILTDIDQFKLLTVALDRLDCWHKPGLLAIGDAAHAMSPIGGIGINLAIQDAVATANILAAPLQSSANVDHLLEKVERRRLLPTRIIQAGQKLAQDNIIGALLGSDRRFRKPPLALRLLNRFPLLRRIPGRIIGLGIRREHVRSPLAKR